MPYKVTSPLVIVPNADGESGDGYFYRDAVIPDGFNDERCKVLAQEGLLEQVKAEEIEEISKPSAPTKSASKADWVAYATDEARGADKLSAEEAEAKTRDELVAIFEPKA